MVILLVDEDGEKLVATAAKGLEEEVERGFTLPIGRGFAGRVAKERRPVVIDDLKPGQAVNPLLYEKGLCSLLGVPLVVENRLVGVLHVGSLTKRDFSDSDVEILQVAGDRAALAISHAHLYEAERRARIRAEEAVIRLEHLQSVTEAALAYLDLDDLLAVLLERVTAFLEADTAAILLVDEDGGMLAARAAMGLEEEVARGFKLPIGEGFAGRVAAERQPVVIVDPGPDRVVNPLLWEKGIRSLLGVPLVVERRLVGVLHVGKLVPHVWGDADIELLQAVADRAALAIEHDRLFEQYRIAERLQRSLLPAALPRLGGVALAARYQPAAASSAVGGDWYDVIALPDGAVGIAIGDVVGHGIDAATLMGRLRSALHAYALEGVTPAELAPRLARFADEGGSGGMATYLYGVLDSDSDVFRFVNGSHPAPVLVRPDGTASYVSSPLAPPLGVARAPAVEEQAVRLEPGCTLLLYTDGLIERRGVRLAGRQEELLAAARGAPFDPELLCDAVLGKLTSDDGVDDDVALLAIQRLPASDRPLEVTVATRAEELAAIRRLLRSWLHDAGAEHSTISAVLLASGEACANAMEHAYGPGDQTFDVTAQTEDGDIVVTVRDRGSWRPPRGRNRGRGIRFMETFMDEVEIIPGDEGTVVRMRKRLRG